MFISLKEKETVRAAYRTPMHKKTMAALSRRPVASSPRGEQSAFQRAEPIPGILNAEAANGARRLLIAAHDRPQKSFDVLARCGGCCCYGCLAHSILIAACQYGENHATHAPALPRAVTDVVVVLRKKKRFFFSKSASRKSIS
jgi:hypothetical protein